MTLLGPFGMIIYFYLYKPFTRDYVLVIAFNTAIIVFVGLYVILYPQIEKARNEAIKHTNDLFMQAVQQLKESLKKD